MNRLTIVEIDFDNCRNALRQLSKMISTIVKIHFDSCRTNSTLKSFTLITGMKEFLYLRDSFIYKREM